MSAAFAAPVSALLLLLLLLLATVVVPAAAAAATPPVSYEGTYECSGVGVDSNGKKATSAVTVWPQDHGSKTRLVIRFERVGVTVATEGPEQWVDETTLKVPVSVDSSYAEFGAVVTLAWRRDRWTITGVGNGKILSYKGSGVVVGPMVVAGVSAGSVWQQVKDMGSAIVDGPVDTSQGTTGPVTVPDDLLGGGSGGGKGGGAAGGLPEGTPADLDYAAVPYEDVDEGSAVAPAEAAPPVADADVLKAMAILLLVLAFAVGFKVMMQSQWSLLLRADGSVTDKQMYDAGHADYGEDLFPHVAEADARFDERGSLIPPGETGTGTGKPGAGARDGGTPSGGSD